MKHLTMTFVIDKPLQIPIFILAWMIMVKEKWDIAPMGRTAGTLCMALLTYVNNAIGRGR